MTLLMTSLFNKFENDVITIDMKSAGIHLLNYQSLRHTQPFLFLDKSTGSILPFTVLPLSLKSSLLLSINQTNLVNINDKQRRVYKTVKRGGLKSKKPRMSRVEILYNFDDVY